MEDMFGLADEITAWIGDYARSNGIETLVIGVSGGIDSAVTSTLSARTGLPTIVPVSYTHLTLPTILRV